MPTSSPITRQSIGRTFIVASVVLGVVALGQLGAVTWAFLKRIQQPAVAKAIEDQLAEAPSKIDITKFGPRPMSTEDTDPPLDPNDVGLPEVTGTQPRPTPVPLTALTPKVDSRFTELIEQGKFLRNSGDTVNALGKFRDAQNIEPLNALPVAEQAYTYEKMSLPDKAAEQWRHILAMGEGAGVYFTAAEAKLKNSQYSAMKENPSDDETPIPSGKTLGLGAPAMMDDTDPTRRFTLRVPIKARANEVISVRDAVTQVLFYDQLGGKDIVRTTANVSYRWSTPPADWINGETEVLEVTYDLPQPDARDPRKYFGYVVRLYYQGELQDTRAEPPNLNQRFPAPYTLSKDNDR